MLVRYELAIKQLYEAFAALFPGRQGFWQRIAGDEQCHAERLEALRSQGALRDWFLSSGRYKAQALSAAIGYVEKQTAKARTRSLNLVEALAVSRDLEGSLLEKQFSTLGDAVPAEIRSVLMDLARETEGHRNAVVDALEAEKRR